MRWPFKKPQIAGERAGLLAGTVWFRSDVSLADQGAEIYCGESGQDVINPKVDAFHRCGQGFSVSVYECYFGHCGRCVRREYTPVNAGDKILGPPAVDLLDRVGRDIQDRQFQRNNRGHAISVEEVIGRAFADNGGVADGLGVLADFTVPATEVVMIPARTATIAVTATNSRMVNPFGLLNLNFLNFRNIRQVLPFLIKVTNLALTR